MSARALSRGWVKVRTKEIRGVEPSSSHGQEVFDNPLIYGLTDIEQQLMLSDSSPSKDNSDLIKWLAMKHNWIRTVWFRSNPNESLTIEGYKLRDIRRVAMVCLSNMGLFVIKTQGDPFSPDCAFEPMSNFNSVRLVIGVRSGPSRSDLKVYRLSGDYLMDFLYYGMPNIDTLVATKAA